MRVIVAAVMLAFALAGPAAIAQTVPQRLIAATQQSKDLELPTEASSLSSFSAPRLALYKPDGPGPFPAVVLHHQCGGLGAAAGTWQNISMLSWAKVAVAHGYVALVLDSLGPRGVDTVCMGPKGGVNFARGVRDAFQAAEHLGELGFVDRERIVFAGFSWGAMVGVLASGKTWASALSAGERFRAVAALYPGCFTIRPPGGTPFEIVAHDIDQPLLVLMGDKDTETPPAECLERLEPLKAAGAPVEWHVYAGATHCWDCESLNGFRKTDFRGHEVVYSFDKSLTGDSVSRVFSFFDAAFTRH